ncbi:ribosomal protein bL12 [Candidatus Carsonella ruddii]|uniref:Ribosomal protein L7/L12 n=1 Tax=Candidatus Carsonella ruddii PC isolate NHV TaxID=1202540 RepID=J3TWP7_CARRU|nr:ribosomal protein L7/L12 [Candidatus Carsonella ruddii]AFP84390.1 ribosomal protein L7/L12 [Candidatus Carsonella ruddii PC isolate NHV]
MENNIVNNILNSISKLNLLEINKLISDFEIKFGLVSSNEKNIEKNKFDIYLKEIGNNKLNLIKTIKEITNLNLKESKILVDTPNSLIKKNVNKQECDEIIKKITLIGGKVEIK